MFDELELVKYLIERRIERLGIDALYADEVELRRIEAARQELEDVVTDVVESVQELNYEEETTIYTPFGEPMMSNLPHITTATGRDMAEFFRERRIPFE